MIIAELVLIIVAVALFMIAKEMRSTENHNVIMNLLKNIFKIIFIGIGILLMLVVIRAIL